MYGLFVEHTLSDMTLWEGEDGATYFYQSELPYDAEEAFRGCGYRVGEAVQRHRATGVGVYAYFRDHDVTVPFAIQAPDREGVSIQNALTKYLNGGPKTFVPGKCLLQCEKKYGRIQCVVKKGDRCLGSSTDTDKDKAHFASA
ncbi:3-beta-glucosidase) (Laminarinase) (SacteLam55A) [Durusdinium trenchii]|uniref:3-beta-glucosidase (Laminarinase (SacteLam55A n=1 Tax=Durusdinium trenchii TaxID=1381693 RepID=A0ABP0RUC1_9DINO